MATTSLFSGGQSARKEASFYDSGVIKFYDGDPSSTSPTLLAKAFLRAKAFDEPRSGIVALRGTPLALDKELGVNATATYAVIEDPLGEHKTLLTVGTSTSDDVVLNRTDINDGDGNTVQIDQFRIERAGINDQIDDLGTVSLKKPLGGETFTEGGVGSWEAEADLGDLRIEEMRLQESTDGGSTWTTKDTIYYTVDRRRGQETDGPDNAGWREDYEEGVWTVDASATHVRAQMLLEDGRTVESSQVGINTEVPAATFSSLSNLLAADPTNYNPGDRVIVDGQAAHGQEFMLAEDGAETNHGTVFMADQDTTTGSKTADTPSNLGQSDGISLVAVVLVMRSMSTSMPPATGGGSGSIMGTSTCAGSERN